MSPSIKPFFFRAVQLGTPRGDGEGLRIGAVRFLPRGVPKTEYARRDYFDLWLPSLAPSRELLRTAKEGSLSLRRFFNAYRREMAETDARQTIRLIAEMARRTPVSVGCYCGHESRCHRSVLRALIREAAGEPEIRPWAERCIYTITHPENLEEFMLGETASGDLQEGRAWTTASSMLAEADSAGQRVALLFGDATDCSRLTHVAQLDGIAIQDAQTDYWFSGLKQLKGRHSPQELILCSTGESIAPGFIRPYAIVERPQFVKNERSI